MEYIKTFEHFVFEEIVSITDKYGTEFSFDKDEIQTKIKNLHKLPKEYKESVIDLVEFGTRANNGIVTGLSLDIKLKQKIKNGDYPDGYSMGVDKNGYFVHTHRARSKSYESPEKIPVKDLKFIDSTG